MYPQKLAAYTQDSLLRENTSGGLFLYVKRILKDLLLFKVVKKVLTSL